jgi:hypothetical protein
LKPVRDGAVVNCRPKDLCFVCVQLILDFAPPQPLHICSRNTANVPRNLTTF